MKKVSTRLGILIIVAAAIVLFGGAWAYQRYAISKSQLPISSENLSIKNSNFETADSSAEALATVDWKTYKNENYGYIIKYPKEWRYSDRYSSNTVANIQDENANWRIEIGQNLDIYNEPRENIPFSEGINTAINFIKNGYKANNYDSKEMSDFKQEKMIVSGRESTKISYQYNKTVYYITVFIPYKYTPNQNSVFAINYVSDLSSNLDTENDDILFSKILSTFKFTPVK